HAGDPGSAAGRDGGGGATAAGGRGRGDGGAGGVFAGAAGGSVGAGRGRQTLAGEREGSQRTAADVSGGGGAAGRRADADPRGDLSRVREGELLPAGVLLDHPADRGGAG